MGGATRLKTPTLIDAGLVALYLAISMIALRLMGFGWWWTIPLALIIAGTAWAVGRMGAPG